MTAQQAIDHEWLSNKDNRVQFKIHKSVMMNLRACNKPQELQYLMLLVFCQFLNDDEINAIKETFYFMDEDMSGSIELTEIKRAYEEMRKGLKAKS